MGLALLEYADAHGRLPAAAVRSKDGKPLLSWRVLILPYLEQKPLFDKFKQDEPWDSPHNVRLLGEMPRTYAHFYGAQAPEPYMTFYRVFVGKGTAFEGREGLSLKDDFPDGLSNTLLIVEAAEAVPWTKPDELPYEPAKPLPRVGGLVPGGFNAA